MKAFTALALACFAILGSSFLCVPEPLRDGITVDTISALKALGGGVDTTYSVRGYSAINDGGGGVFYWNPSDTRADNGGTIIAVNSGATGRFNRLFTGDFNVLWFGAKSDGVTDSTTAIQATITAATSQNASVYIAAGNYKVTTLLVSNGLTGIYGPGVLVDSGVSGNGVLCLNGPNIIGGAAVQNCYVSVNITMANGALVGIFADQAIQCTFDRCYISGFTDANVNGVAGIKLFFGSKQCLLRGNNIVFPNAFPGSQPTNPQYGIVCIGNTTSYAGYFSGSGTISEPTSPVDQLVISGNYVKGGSHAISLNGVYHSSVTGNTLYGSRDRCIILEPCCRHNSVTGNALKDFGSSGIHMSYGSAFNAVVGNVCRSMSATGEAAIQAYVGVSYNLIEGNQIQASSNYGVYVAVNADHNKVMGNAIYDYKLAAVALESDWESPLPGGATYSRPNYLAPPSGTQWAFGNTQYNEIRGNTIYESAGGNQCGVYLSHIAGGAGASNLNDNLVAENRQQAAGVTKYLMVFEETSGHAINNKLIGNTYISFSTSKLSFSRNVRAHFNLVEGNEGINCGASSEVTISDGVTTPDVSVGNLFTTSNSTSISITNFLNGSQGQEFTLRIDANTTVVYNASLIRTKGAVNITGDSNSFIRFRNVSGIWFEIYRNF